LPNRCERSGIGGDVVPRNSTSARAFGHLRGPLWLVLGIVNRPPCRGPCSFSVQVLARFSGRWRSLLILCNPDLMGWVYYATGKFKFVRRRTLSTSAVCPLGKFGFRAWPVSPILRKAPKLLSASSAVRIVTFARHRNPSLLPTLGIQTALRPIHYSPFDCP